MHTFKGKNLKACLPRRSFEEREATFFREEGTREELWWGSVLLSLALLEGWEGREGKRLLGPSGGASTRPKSNAASLGGGGGSVPRCRGEWDARQRGLGESLLFL